MEEIKLSNPELDLLTYNKQDGYNFRERRHDPWTINYDLYRDKIQTNRLIQRQTVHLPLMKQVIKTLLKDVDDMPVIYFENLDNDKQAELFKNEYWKYTVEQNRMELNDIVDKKQVFLFGRSFDQWQIVDGKVKQTIEDPMDILVSRYTDPVNLHSSRFLIHINIFKPLSSLEKDEKYDQDAVARLKKWYASENGLVKVKQNEEMYLDKNKKMADIGVSDAYDPTLGETYVEVSQHFVYRDTADGKGEELYLIVEAEDQEILMKKRLEEVMGVTKDHFFRNHFPYESWADDLERQDFWSDGVGDIVRGSNQILDSWYSQLVENRTLRNFGMQYFDSTADEEFQPNTFNPTPWGWYPVPGDPNKIIRRIDIPDLSESLDEMTYVNTMLEKATGATATQQGNVQEKQVTLGEVQLALGEAKERVKGMSKFYTPAWKARGIMFDKICEAGADKLDAVKIYKKGRNSDNVYSMEISPKDWQSEEGYNVRVWSMEDKNTQDQNELQKVSAVKANMPTNGRLNEIYQRKLLEFAGLKPDEINDVIEEEKRIQQAIMTQPTTPSVNPQPQPQPVVQEPIAPITPESPAITPAKPKSNKKVASKLKSIKSKLNA